jgi:hypothetical protein
VIETRIFERYVQAAGAPLKILVSKSHHFRAAKNGDIMHAV